MTSELANAGGRRAVASKSRLRPRVPGKTITRVAWLALFIHVAVLQMRFAPTRPDRPNNFGGSFVFYTVQCNLILLAYVALSTVEALFGSRAPTRLTSICSAASGCCWTLGSLMGTLYYAFVHWHPLTRERAQQIVAFDRHMHVLHLSPVLFVVWDTIFMEYEKFANYAIRFRTEVMIVAAYACSYIAWLLVIVRRTSWWPYPFLAQLSPQGLTALFAAVLFGAIPGVSYVGRRVRCCGATNPRARAVRPRPHRRPVDAREALHKSHGVDVWLRRRTSDGKFRKR